MLKFQVCSIWLQFHEFISRPLNVGFPALGAAPGAGETFTFFKNKPTFHTPGGMNNQSFISGGYGTGNVVQVIIDFFFHNPDRLGNVNSGHRAVTQVRNDLFADGFCCYFFSHFLILRIPSRRVSSFLQKQKRTSSFP